MSAKKNTETSNDTPTSRRQRRAAERAARGGKSPKKDPSSGSRSNVALITGGAIAIGVVAVLVLAFAGGDSGGSSMPPVTAAAAPAPAQELRVGRSLGDSDAAVTIDVFEDPQCPACGLFTERIEPLLVAGPVSDGEVFFTYRDMAFLGDESIDAAAAMRVAQEMDGKFWDYHNVLFANQDPDNLENRGAFTPDRLADAAELVGLDRDAFLSELDDPRYAAAVADETAEAQALGVNSTPTLSINGELIRGAPSWDQLQAMIAQAATAASAENAPEADPTDAG